MSDEETVREEVDVDSLAKEINVPDLQQLDLGDGGQTLVSMPEGGPDAVSDADSTADAVQMPDGDYTITAPVAEGAGRDESAPVSAEEPRPVMTEQPAEAPAPAEQPAEQPATEEEPPGQGLPPGVSEDHPSFSSMKKDELVAEAEARGIDTEGKTRADLIEELGG